MPAKNLDADMRKSVNAAFEAMSEWRDSMAQSNERYADAVFSKMADAAKTMGWPAQMVEATQTQMKQATQMQVQMIDQVMDAWQAQAQAPNPFAAPTDFFSKMQVPGFNPKSTGVGGFPGMPGMPGFGEFPNMMNMFGNAPMPPMQFWMQAAEMWQKSFETAMQMWSNGQGGPGFGGQDPKGRSGGTHGSR